jgi:ferric-dicitrate binding protein FerR (iron transport regulator)
MSKEVFYNLLRKYLEGNCTEEERRIVEQWYGMLDDEELPALADAELEEIGKKLWARVDHGTLVAPEPVRRKTTVRRLWPVVGIAAAAIGIVMTATYVVFMINDTPGSPVFMGEEASVEVITKTNDGKTPLTVYLPDSSRAVLQPLATLTYPAVFAAARREVVIRGEGFFDVRKNAARPFLVFSERLVTRVVGTSFIVKALAHAAQSEVTVLTGRVIVMHPTDRDDLYEKLVNPKKEVELTPNYKAVYREEGNSLLVTIADDPVPLTQSGANRAGSFDFSNAAVKDVLASLEATYGIGIRSGEDVDRCTFTGDLSGQNLYERLDFICQAIGAAYTVSGAEIIVKGGNCK